MRKRKSLQSFNELPLLRIDRETGVVQRYRVAKAARLQGHCEGAALIAGREFTNRIRTTEAFALDGDFQNDHDKRGSYETILSVLCYAFVEIRATDNLLKAQFLADVFHNAPTGIAVGRRADAIEAEVCSRADRLQCRPQIEAMFESARENAARSKLRAAGTENDAS